MGFWMFKAVNLQEQHKGNMFCVVFVKDTVSWRPADQFIDKEGQNSIRLDFKGPYNNFYEYDTELEEHENICKAHVDARKTDPDSVSEDSNDYANLDVWVLLIALLTACCFAVGGFYTYNYIRDEELKREYTREAMMGHDDVYHHYTTDDTTRSDGP